MHRARVTGPAGFERMVAVKCLRERYRHEPQMVAMLAEEARVGATLIHPNVAHVLDFGCEDGVYFLALELVDGIDLEEVFRHLRSIGCAPPLATTLTIVAQLLAGLGAAHERRDAEGRRRPVVHRDVSPGNVLLRTDGWVKVTDFGLARPLDRTRRTDPGVVKGKYSYLTPEQTVDLPVDARSDLFQVGIVMWETLTGRSLFKRENEYETFLAVREAPIPPPSSVDPEVPREIDDVVLRALERDPSRRFPTAASFREAIERVLRGQDRGVEPALVAELVASVRAGRDFRMDRPSDPGLVPWTDPAPAWSSSLAEVTIFRK